MTPLAWALLLGGIFYVAVCLITVTYQREFLYRPWKFLIDPRLCAVDGVELVDIHPQKDEKLFVWHLPPAQEGAPVLIYFDGNRGNISIWNRRWRRIAAAGAGFIAVSYRGYGGSTSQPSEKGLHEDAAYAWNWATKQYPEAQLALHGYSLGTGFAAKLATKLTNTPVILEAPYISAINRAREMLPFLPVGLILKDTIRTDKWIKKIKGPILITHGNKDMIVPYHHGKRLYKMAKKPKQFVRFEGCNHLNMTANGLYPVIWRFLDYKPEGDFLKKAYEGDEPPLFDAFDKKIQKQFKAHLTAQED